jgi:hypothetical protein|tara:strand:+ start:121 stop:330 length:210 start_codon:yes stop_codon:yes gene_type:complete
MKNKKYSIGHTYTVWKDVTAKNEEEAIDIACNSNYSVNVYIGKQDPRCTVKATAELNEYEDPKVHEYDK